MTALHAFIEPSVVVIAKSKYIMAKHIRQANKSNYIAVLNVFCQTELGH